MGSSHGATYNDFMVFGGFVGEPESASATTEYWNGSAWTELNDLSTARSGIMGAGTSTAALSTGGPSGVAQTEEWTAPATFRQFNIGDIYYNAAPSSGVIKYVGYGRGAWASAPALNQGRIGLEGFGTNTAAVAAGGGEPTVVGKTETYNGSSWTEVTDLNQARRDIVGTGSSTAGMIINAGVPTPNTSVEQWDGSSWTEITETGSGQGFRAASTAALNTATLVFGGYPSVTADTELWNGSSWAEQSNLNTARYGLAGMGTSTAVIGASGSPYPIGNITNVESWDGSSWTEIADVNTARRGTKGSGTSTSAIFYGGQGPVDNTESWNGTAWTEVADMSQARGWIGSAGANSATAALAIGGEGPPVLASVEEWAVPVALKTLASTNA